MTFKQRPYGWGCKLFGTYCYRQASEGWKACLCCRKIKDHPQYEEILKDVKKLIRKEESQEDA